MDVTIRTATARDVPTILQFIRELAEYEHLSHQVVASEAALRDSLFGDRPTAEVLIAEQSGEPAGFALFFHNYSTFLAQSGIYLEDLYVSPAARGRGIGRGLLERIAAIAVERHCGRVEWAVLDWNENARRFYEGLGARRMADWMLYRITGDALHALAGTPSSDGHGTA